MHASDTQAEDNPEKVHYDRYGRLIIVPEGNGQDLSVTYFLFYFMILQLKSSCVFIAILQVKP